MSKPAVEVAEVVRRFGYAFLEAYGASLSRVQKTVLRALVLCRTSALGGHLERCDNPDCSYQRPAYNSCLMGSLSLWGVRRERTCSQRPHAFSTLH